MTKRETELEPDFATFVEMLLTLKGYQWYHTYNSKRSREGFQDYVAVKGVWVYFIELKGVDGQGRPGKLEPAQIVWRDALTPEECPVSTCKAIHASSFVWWPWMRDEIMETLR